MTNLYKQVQDLKNDLSKIEYELAIRYLSNDKNELSVLLMVLGGFKYSKIAKIKGISRVKVRRIFKRSLYIYTRKFIKNSYSGLNNKTSQFLMADGYYSKNDIRKALKQGKFNPDIESEDHTLNIGFKRYIEICDWLNEVPIHRNYKLEEKIKSAKSYLKKHGYKVTKL